MIFNRPQPTSSSPQSEYFDASGGAQHLHTLRHEPALVSCPSCNELAFTQIEHAGNSTLRFWPFNTLPCCGTDCKDSVHKCGKCARPLAIAKRKGDTEVVLPVAVRRNISREELSRPRSARLPNAPNFSRPGTAGSRILLSPTVPGAAEASFASRFPPPVPDMAMAKDGNKMPLSIIIKKSQGMDGTDSVVELPHVSPTSPKSLARSHTGSSSESRPGSKSPESIAPSSSDVFHSIPPSPANFPGEPERSHSSTSHKEDEMDRETIHAR